MTFPCLLLLLCVKPGRPIVIIGTGGSGRETLALLHDIERTTPGSWQFRGFLGLDEPPRGLLDRLGADFLGDPRTLVERIPEAHGWTYALGIGNPQHRLAMEVSLTSQGLEPASLVHPSVLIGPDVEIGPGAVVCANTVITTNVRIGASTQVNIGCVIAHDARIGDYVTFAQSVNIAGNVAIEDDATLFTGAVVMPGIRVGGGAVVGAGAVVRKDVVPQSVVAGVPARIIRHRGVDELDPTE